MKFEKKEPEVRIQPFNQHKNPWARCTCQLCGISYIDGDRAHYDGKGNMTLGWHGQSLSGGYLWDCAKCVYETKVKCGAIEEKQDE